REEIVSADPEEAHRRLVEHRKRKARTDQEGVYSIQGKVHRHKITRAKEPFLVAILDVLTDRRAYWPLTVRQIHYALLNAPPLIHARKPYSGYGNNRESYKALDELSVRARLQKLIPWGAIHDPTRHVTLWNCYPSVQPFVRKELDGFLKGFYRNLQQSQPNHI